MSWQSCTFLVGKQAFDSVKPNILKELLVFTWTHLILEEVASCAFLRRKQTILLQLNFLKELFGITWIHSVLDKVTLLISHEWLHSHMLSDNVEINTRKGHTFITLFKEYFWLLLYGAAQKNWLMHWATSNTGTASRDLGEQSTSICWKNFHINPYLTFSLALPLHSVKQQQHEIQLTELCSILFS